MAEEEPPSLAAAPREEAGGGEPDEAFRDASEGSAADGAPAGAAAARQPATAEAAGGGPAAHSVDVGPETSVGLSLEDAIQQGKVPEPPLLTWQGWQKWRTRAGLRPPAGGLPRSQWLRREPDLRLWAMRRYHGPDWRQRLDVVEVEEEAGSAAPLPGGPAVPAGALLLGERALSGRVLGLQPIAALPRGPGGTLPPVASPRRMFLAPPAPAGAGGGAPGSPVGGRGDAPAAPAAGAGGGGGAGTAPLGTATAAEHYNMSSGASEAFTQGSWKGKSSEELRELATTDFDPTIETYEDFQSRVFRSVAVLDVRGSPVEEAALQTLAVRAKYIAEAAGMTEPEAAAAYRSALGRLLESGEEGRHVELHTSVLLQLLAEAGASASAGRGSVLGRLFNTTPERAPRRPGEGADDLSTPPGLWRAAAVQRALRRSPRAAPRAARPASSWRSRCSERRTSPSRSAFRPEKARWNGCSRYSSHNRARRAPRKGLHQSRSRRR